MVVLSVIFGVIMIFAGISAMCTPLVTFLSAGYFIGILMFMYGIAGIVKAFQKRSDAFQTVMSVLALIAGIVSIARPGSTLAIDGVLIYCVAFWFLLRGILAATAAFQTRKFNKGWIWGLIIGIAGILLGVYTFIHPMFTAVTTGILIGLYFVEAGIDLIVFATAMGAIKDTVDQISEGIE